MLRYVAVCSLFILNASGILYGQKAADPGQRYFRVICLVHLTGSGQAGDPIVPEYVAKGRAVAVAAERAAASQATANAQTNTAPRSADRTIAAGNWNGAPVVTAKNAPTASRPGILAWNMQKSDDGTMAIVQMVAADHHAFDEILADKRSEIRVFEIGRTPAATIQAALQQYKKDFDLNAFRVVVK